MYAYNSWARNKPKKLYKEIFIYYKKNEKYKYFEFFQIFIWFLIFHTEFLIGQFGGPPQTINFIVM